MIRTHVRLSLMKSWSATHNSLGPGTLAGIPQELVDLSKNKMTINKCLAQLQIRSDRKKKHFSTKKGYQKTCNIFVNGVINNTFSKKSSATFITEIMQAQFSQKHHCGLETIQNLIKLYFTKKSAFFPKKC